jgi:hypothetical protein
VIHRASSNNQAESDNSFAGREYKASTFVSKTKKNAGKVYMLAIDAARCAGFRDSLYFFRRNPWINKINCSQEEKDILISVGRLHTNLKSRQVTIVAAGNCFRVFGARFVKSRFAHMYLLQVEVQIDLLLQTARTLSTTITKPLH